MDYTVFQSQKLNIETSKTEETNQEIIRASRQAMEFSQCYSSTSCSGDVVQAISAKDCCVGTDNGLSFSDSGDTCTVCVGKLYPVSLPLENDPYSIAQFMDSLWPTPVWKRVGEWIFPLD